MWCIAHVLPLERSFTAIFYISLILIARKFLNRNSFRFANLLLWSFVFLRLIFPYSLCIKFHFMHETGYLSEFMNLLLEWVRFKDLQIQKINEIFPMVNRFVVMISLGIYITWQIIKTMRALWSASRIKENAKIDFYVQQVPMRRKVTVLINDHLKAPITYGLLRPKIILQSRILKDDTLLQYVLLHELTHIKKWDAMWNYAKYIVACIFWYNPFIWIMALYLEKDLETLCDKLVIKNSGNTDEHKKQYSIAMLELMTQSQEKPEKKKLGLAFHPSVERMIILKNWKLSKVGIFVFLLLFSLSSTAFMSAEEDRMPVTTVLEGSADEQTINVYNRTKIISVEEYKSDYFKLSLEKEPEVSIQSANIHESNTLSGFQSKSYSFNMTSWTGAAHNKLVTSIGDVSSSGKVEYRIVIQEDGSTIYSSSFSGNQSLVTNDLKANKTYTVTIINSDSKNLSYTMAIQSARQ